MSSNLREIKPRLGFGLVPGGQQSPSQPPWQPPEETPPPKAKRQLVLAACNECRRRKSKCDAARPKCSACGRKGTACSYDVDPDETRVQSIKRKNTNLETELASLRDIYFYLRVRPEAEALEVLRCIRSAKDIETVVHFIRDGDLHAQPRQVSAEDHQNTYMSGNDPSSSHDSRQTESSQLLSLLLDLVKSEPLTPSGLDGMSGRGLEEHKLR
ncbi:hypothetical protein LTR66_003792 [Elasticomyces elasticus]|nr:hypothetical protein LTR50_003547 [Elasticomyces elasticus]KAK4996622.1 hypothetical protein LTR66_003792 [Elasticomyces elasticus]